MRHAATSFSNLYAMRAQIDRFRSEIANMRSTLRKAYNPNQPRIPEGMPWFGVVHGRMLNDN